MFVDHLYSSGFAGTGSGPVVVGQAPPPCDPELGKWKRWMEVSNVSSVSNVCCWRKTPHLFQIGQIQRFILVSVVNDCYHMQDRQP